jgi:hypothetical protein
MWLRARRLYRDLLRRQPLNAKKRISATTMVKIAFPTASIIANDFAFCSPAAELAEPPPTAAESRGVPLLGGGAGECAG